MTFPIDAVCANPVFYRSYSRRKGNRRESWQEVCDRTLKGLFEIGQFDPMERQLIKENVENLKSLPSGRWLWTGGTEWLKEPENFPGAFNCVSMDITDWRSFSYMMEFAMMGCGTGAVLEEKHINQLPSIVNPINIFDVTQIGTQHPSRQEETELVYLSDDFIQIIVGDSRSGWIGAYTSILEIASDPNIGGEVDVIIDVTNVRPANTPLKGFGGVANPERLPDLFPKMAYILNKAVGRKLTAVECCLLIDEGSVVVVAGNIRRSAGIRQFSSEDAIAAKIKMNLWQQTPEGEWRVDPERDALRMANHTRVFHRKPTKQECIDSVKTQYQCGEGALQWAGEAVKRGNADLLNDDLKKDLFLSLYDDTPDIAAGYLANIFFENFGTRISPEDLTERMSRYGLNPCGK